MFDTETKYAMQVMKERNIYRQIAHQYQMALEQILSIQPLESARLGDLSLALGEVRKIASHALRSVPDREAEEELLLQNQERR